jgi:hypothetical protein
MTRAAREVGAARVLCLIPASWPRWAKRCGLEASAAGRVMEIAGAENQCVWIDLAGKLH